MNVRHASADSVRGMIARCGASDVHVPEELGTIVLRSRQLAAARRLIELVESRGGALLAEPVGLGKTYTAIAVARHFSSRVTVAAPAALREMWCHALDECRLEGTVVTHEALSRGARLTPDDAFLIVDETHRFRSPGTRRYATLADACRRSKILLVSATPIQNRRADLAGVLALFLGRVAWTMSDDALAELVVRDADSADVIGGLPRLRGPIPLTLDVDDGCLMRIVSLPPPVPARDESVATALLTYGLVHQWTSSRAALVASLKRRRSRGLAMLAALDAGRQPTRSELGAWTHAGDAMQLAFPELVTESTIDSNVDLSSLVIAVDRHLAGIESLLVYCRTSPDPDRERANALVKVLADHPGERVIAFCHYAETVAALRRYLSAVPGVAALTARGAEVAGGRIGRRDVLAQFTPGRAVAVPRAERIDLLIATDLLSEGLNLQEASVAVHLDLPWNPARLDQRVGRIRRLGSRHESVTVYSVTPPASSEVLLRIEERLRDKLRVAQRTIGVAGRILPTPIATSLDAGLAEHRSAVQSILRCWQRSDRILPNEHDTVVVAAVESAITGFVAVIDDGDRASLAVEVNGVLGEEIDLVRRALDAASGNDVPIPPATLDRVLRRASSYLDRRRASAAVDLGAAAAGRARRAALARVSQALARTPRHRRAQVASLVDAARTVALAQLGEGAERILELLVKSNLPDEAWLRSLAAFGELNIRSHSPPSQKRGPRLIAILVLQPRAL